MINWRQAILKQYRLSMPAMSRTEREAITAGTVTWEGDLFRGNPNWNKLLALPAPTLSAEEQAFIDGPVHLLCQMVDDWQVSHVQADLSPELWHFIKSQGFFGLIIPKKYGGKAFSAYAHSQIITKVSTLSITVSTTIAIPNSLGPAELLLHYGTEEQKNYYLPRLACGEEIPCFALTSMEAGSDASRMTDIGVVCFDIFAGKKVLGIRLNWSKRYITLAPIATVIGLAFKLHDPEQLLGTTEDIGITCALIPRNLPGISIGRRHQPLGTPFQNGPTQGVNVFIPLDYIIGGPAQAGKGWRMLMECLASGRAITLPSSTTGGAKVASYTAGAYARIRRQFHLPIAKFEGIETLLARIATRTYTMNAACRFTVQAIDRGEKPAIASAIIKYHTTELGRLIACDMMDLHGGKAICVGPRNYIARGYVSAPIAITVEGANVLTRNLIIFGQGAIRCHPYVLAEMEAATRDDAQALTRALMNHGLFFGKNILRSVGFAFTSSLFIQTPDHGLQRYMQHATRFCTALALMTDISMISMGGELKRKENISARLGDILSYLYLLSAIFKQFHDQNEPPEDLPIMHYACQYYLYEIQERLRETLENYPHRWLGYLLQGLIFPLGMHFTKPTDELSHEIAKLISAPTETRNRLSDGIYTKYPLYQELQEALLKSLLAEPIEKMVKDGQLITEEQRDIVAAAEKARHIVLAVDDFAPNELAK